MNSLPKPTLGISTKELFELCVSSYADETVRKNLIACSSCIEKASEEFIDSFPHSMHKIEKNIVLPNGITGEQMKKVYSDKFVAKDAPGRKYYDILFSAPKGGKCPICGERVVKNLDHYLPKSTYFTLVVTPENLIPTCRDCNFDKHTYTISEEKDAPLHPYFDDISSEVWLSVNLQADKTVLYEAKCPEGWTDVLKARTKNHLSIYGLDEYYASKAAQEIADEIYHWKQLYTTAGQSELFDYLKDRCASIEKNKLNSWKAALYRGLVSQFLETIKWLI